MSIGSRSPSEFSTDSSHIGNTLHLIRLILEGFKYHPYFFMLRYSLYSSDSIYPFAHQVEILAKLFARRPVRVMIADEIGLGKTITAIMILNYLSEIKRVERALILVPRILIDQWVSELRRLRVWNVRVLERDNIDSYHREGFPPGVYLASIDLIKRGEHKSKILNRRWDLIIVDEAHRVGKTGGRETQRFELVRSLASMPETHLIMLTATPHRGKSEDYIERVLLLDPYIDREPRELDDISFYEAIVDSIVFRRVKTDVNEVYENRKVFTDCRFKARLVKATEEEKEFSSKIVSFLRRKLQFYHEITGESPRPIPLLLTIIAKRASSSPEAALRTLTRILLKRKQQVGKAYSQVIDERRLEERASLIADALLGSSIDDIGIYWDEADSAVGVEIDDVINILAEEAGTLLDDRDLKDIEEIINLARRITQGVDSRLESLVKIIEEHASRGENIVIFTEFKDTAEYVYRRLMEKLPDYLAKKTVLVTSSKIMPPREIGIASRSTIEDVKSWLRKGYARVVVSTDVASEGLNLQLASVVVHYEPTWSPVKIVQRIGRVWRLGQTRDVTSYSLLLDIESDVAVLRILYAKLLSWIVSGVSRDIVIGEELEINMSQQSGSTSSSMNIPLARDRGRPQFSEYGAILNFIRGGEDRLARYIEAIIESLKELKKEAERLWPRRAREVKVRKTLRDGLGGLHGEGGESELKELLISVSRLLGYDIEEKENRIFIRGSDLADLRDARDYYSALLRLTDRYTGSYPIVLIARKPENELIRNARELYLYEVTINMDGEPVYSETIGLAIGDERIPIRGRDLIRVISSIITNVIDVVEDYWFTDADLSDLAKASLGASLNYIIEDFINYLNKSEKNFSNHHAGWKPRSKTELYPEQKLLGVVILVEGDDRSQPEAVEEIEKKAMEIAMDYERRHGRIPEDVSKKEHYDIRSFDPKTGEVRYIEVKGRWPLDISVELTKAEYEFGEEHGENYWLYIVYGFKTGSPRLLAMRNPVRKGLWRMIRVVREEIRYRLLGV